MQSPPDTTKKIQCFLIHFKVKINFKQVINFNTILKLQYTDKSNNKQGKTDLLFTNLNAKIQQNFNKLNL